MFGGKIGLPELAVIVFIALLIFGPKKLGELGKGLGEGIKNFKSSMSEGLLAQPLRQTKRSSSPKFRRSSSQGELRSILNRLTLIEAEFPSSPLASHHSIHPRHGQSNYIEIAAVDALDPARSHALDGVGASLVHGLTRLDVISDLALRKSTEPDFRDLRFGLLETRRDQADSGDHLVHASGQQPQHSRGIVRISRLFQQVPIHHDYGVSAEYHIVGVSREDCTGLVAGQALRVRQGLFFGVGCSAIWAGSTVKEIPALRRSSERRGEAEARIRGMQPRF